MHGVIAVYGDQNQNTGILSVYSCLSFESETVAANSSTTYFLKRLGKVTVYFIQGAQVSVVRIVVTASSPPSSSFSTSLGWALIALAGLTFIVGVALWYRRASDRSPLKYSVMRTSRENESL
jgi:hypothetical protein